MVKPALTAASLSRRAFLAHAAVAGAAIAGIEAHPAALQIGAPLWNPDVNPRNSTFGFISQDRNNPRDIQLGVRVTF